MDSKAIAIVSKELVHAGKELYNRGLVKGTSGNISAKIPGADTFLIKPSGACLGKLHENELVLVDLKGKKVSGQGAVSAETPMHAAIYRSRQDVQAVVHTHAPTATAFGIVGKEILPLQIEVFLALPKGIPIVPFKQPGSMALAEAVQKAITGYDAVILENHGIVTVGATLEAACNLNEMVEEAAKIQLAVMMLTEGSISSLAELEKKFKAYNTVK
ncbi:MAG: class II aldolase/adducin family protein [Candidatus Bathyarchaeia archaeon]